MIALRSIRAKWKWPPTLRKTVLYRILVIGIVILSTVYLIDFTTSHINDISHYTKLLQRPGLLLSRDANDDYGDDVMEVIDENYFVKTTGCRIVKMDVMSEQIR